MTVLHRRDILDIPNYVPGRTIRLEASNNAQLASNESPYPLLADIRSAVTTSLDHAHGYPDFVAADLIDALADHWNLKPEHITVDGGSSNIIRNLALMCGSVDTTILFPWPSFSLYEQATRIAGATPVPVPLDDTYHVTRTTSIWALFWPR